MQVEPGHGLDHCGLGDENRHAIRLRLSDQVGQVGEPALTHQEGPRPMSGVERATDDFLALREIQAALGLELPAQGDVGQREVVAYAFVGWVDDLDRHVRQGYKPGDTSVSGGPS